VVLAVLKVLLRVVKWEAVLAVPAANRWEPQVALLVPLRPLRSVRNGPALQLPPLFPLAVNRPAGTRTLLLLQVANGLTARAAHKDLHREVGSTLKERVTLAVLADRTPFAALVVQVVPVVLTESGAVAVPKESNSLAARTTTADPAVRTTM
jgi:hypothetical protein